MRESPLVRRALGVSVALGLTSTAAIVAQAVALATLLGRAFYDHGAPVGVAVRWFLVATAVRVVSVGLAEPVTGRIAAPMRRDLRRRLLARVRRGDTEQSVDASVQLATTGVDAVESYVANYVPALVLATLAPVVLLGYLALSDPWSALIVTVSVALLPLFMVLLGLEAQDKMRERWDEQQRLAGYFGDVVRGMGVLKAHHRARHDVDQLDEVGRRLQRTTMSTLRVAFLSSFALELLSSLATALVALVLGLRLMDGSLRLSVALAVLLVTPEVYLPLRRSAAQYHGGAVGIAAARAVLDLVAIDAAGPSRVPPTASPTIELRDVRVATEGRYEVDPVSGVIPAGEVTVLRGASGSGKTSLLRAVVGLADTTGGAIEIDGVDLRELDLDLWHDRIAYLPQDPRLPGATVREVLSMGDDTIDERAMREVLASLALSLDLDRPVGEGASSLSAGQRRRLALARGLVRRPLVLVLDEPTAHLDPRSETLVVAAIGSLTMTRIVATHRPFAADHVIDLDRSRASRG